MMISEKSAEKKFGEEILTLYINRVTAEMSGKPECFLDSIIRREKLRQFSAESLRDADYDFLNTLFACFPEVIFNTPGIMQQHWLNKALLPENLGKTALALVAGYQSFAVLRSHSLFDEAADVPVVDRFNDGFKEAFGMHPSRFAMQLPQLDKESAKYLLRYIKKSPARQTSDYNIVGSVRFGFSGRCLAIKAMGLSGYFNSAKVVDDMTRTQARMYKSAYSAPMLTMDLPPSKGLENSSGIPLFPPASLTEFCMTKRRRILLVSNALSTDSLKRIGRTFKSEPNSLPCT